MNGLRAPLLAVSIALLGIVLLVSGQVILAGAGPLTGYQRMEGLLGLGASAAGLAVVGWWLAAIVLALAGEVLNWAGEQQAARITAILTPAFMKQLAAAVVGLQLVGGIPATMAHGFLGHPVTAPARTTPEDPAHAANTSTVAPGQDRRPVSPQWKPVPAPADGGPLLSGPHRSAAGAATGTGPGQVVVTPGDSLWTIAAHHLGPFATDVEIAASWPSWYRANRQVIGADPHLLLPGQLLQVPPTTR